MQDAVNGITKDEIQELIDSKAMIDKFNELFTPFKEAVLNGEILKERYENYLKFYLSVKQTIKKY